MLAARQAGDEARAKYVASLASVTGHGATLYVLCFSDVGTDTGPHPVSRDELAAPFGPGSGWKVAGIEADRVLTRFHDDHGAPLSSAVGAVVRVAVRGYRCAGGA